MLKQNQGNHLKFSVVYVFSPIEAPLAKSISAWVIRDRGLRWFICVSQRPHTLRPVWAACTQPTGLIFWTGAEAPPSSLQTDVDLAHPSSLARPPSIMGFAKQGVRKRETVGWDAASHDSLCRPLLAPFPLSDGSTHSQAKYNSIWNKPCAGFIQPSLFCK